MGTIQNTQSDLALMSSATGHGTDTQHCGALCNLCALCFVWSINVL